MGSSQSSAQESSDEANFDCRQLSWGGKRGCGMLWGITGLLIFLSFLTQLTILFYYAYVSGTVIDKWQIYIPALIGWGLQILVAFAEWMCIGMAHPKKAGSFAANVLNLNCWNNRSAPFVSGLLLLAGILGFTGTTLWAAEMNGMTLAGTRIDYDYAGASLIFFGIFFMILAPFMSKRLRYMHHVEAGSETRPLTDVNIGGNGKGASAHSILTGGQ